MIALFSEQLVRAMVTVPEQRGGTLVAVRKELDGASSSCVDDDRRPGGGTHG